MTMVAVPCSGRMLASFLRAPRLRIDERYPIAASHGTAEAIRAAKTAPLTRAAICSNRSRSTSSRQRPKLGAAIYTTLSQARPSAPNARRAPVPPPPCEVRCRPRGEQTLPEPSRPPGRTFSTFATGSISIRLNPTRATTGIPTSAQRAARRQAKRVSSGPATVQNTGTSGDDSRRCHPLQDSPTRQGLPWRDPCTGTVPQGGSETARRIGQR
jgi:hypothetical protein